LIAVIAAWIVSMRTAGSGSSTRRSTSSFAPRTSPAARSGQRARGAVEQELLGADDRCAARWR